MPLKELNASISYKALPTEELWISVKRFEANKENIIPGPQRHQQLQLLRGFCHQMINSTMHQQLLACLMRTYMDNNQVRCYLKHSFLCNLWAWSRLFLDLGPPSVAEFVDWLGPSWEGHCFFGHFLVPLLGICCILPVYYDPLF